MTIHKKPFDNAELLARIKALIRRYDSIRQTKHTTAKPGFDFVSRSKSAYIASQPLKLTTTEFDILVLLISNTDKVFSRELLFNKLGMKVFQGDTRSIDMHIQRLRKKIAEFTNVKYIETVFGIGYK
jgi:DNA-binding response OmpR family regulator